MCKYSIGMDFGTLSGRALLVSVEDGRIAASAEKEYAHGVMDTTLPDGTALPYGWALQDPADYMDVMLTIVPELLRRSGIDKENIIGIGTDFTASTVMPVDAEGMPLCLKNEFRHNPHAYVKHWKHHGAQAQANRMTETAAAMNEKWIDDYGGKISCENAFTKLLEVYENDRKVYAEMAAWVEAADWIVWQLTGRNTLSTCCAGYKFFYSPERGFPCAEYLEALSPGFGSAAKDKLRGEIVPVGSCAGRLKKEMAEKLGLLPGIAVAAGTVDAHAGVPAAGITREGQMLAVIGTSSCFMAMTDEKKNVPGISGIVRDGILPGMFGYEAGQNCVGDMFAWFAKNLVPEEYSRKARRNNVPIQSYLAELAEKLRPGESGLMALDWWSGNRSPLSDYDISGMILGLTLQTKPEEIYRAFVEATAFGARLILDNYAENGVQTDEFFASGGISQKSTLAMQIYADVLNMPVKVVDSQGSALGSAIWGATAASEKNGVCADPVAVVRAMSGKTKMIFYPVPENAEIYDRLYQEYKTLYEMFGACKGNVMKTLTKIKRQINMKQ